MASTLNLQDSESLTSSSINKSLIDAEETEESKRLKKHLTKEESQASLGSEGKSDSDKSSLADSHLDEDNLSSSLPAPASEENDDMDPVFWRFAARLESDDDDEPQAEQSRLEGSEELSREEEEEHKGGSEATHYEEEEEEEEAQASEADHDEEEHIQASTEHLAPAEPAERVESNPSSIRRASSSLELGIDELEEIQASDEEMVWRPLEAKPSPQPATSNGDEFVEVQVIGRSSEQTVVSLSDGADSHRQIVFCPSNNSGMFAWLMSGIAGLVPGTAPAEERKDSPESKK